MYINTQSHTNTSNHNKSEEKLMNLERVKSTSININDGIESYNQMRRIENRSRTLSIHQSDSQFYSPLKSKRDDYTINNSNDSINQSRY